MGRPAEHNEATGIVLLNAAEKILAQEGPGAVSVRRVANAVGVSTRAVYTVFENKDGLLAELAVRGYVMLRQGLQNIESTDDVSEDMIRSGIEAFRSFANSKPHLYRLTFERIPILVAAHPAVITARRDLLEVLLKHVRRARDNDVFRQEKALHMALTYHALCVGLANWELGQKPEPVGVGIDDLLSEDAIAAMWRMGLTALVRGLAPEPK